MQPNMILIFQFELNVYLEFAAQLPYLFLVHLTIYFNLSKTFSP